MNDAAIQVRGLGKRYRLGGSEPYKTLRSAITSSFTAPLRWMRRSGDDGDRTLWALRDVTFDVKPGEVIGIIGRNGAGKSTLLKILSRITTPTEGFAEIHGRVGSLLEVGTGFHPELTGRENIFMNGAILGMRRAEITAKFDDIVAFAEVEKFLDTPVKFYSSGMYMRLAFAVAAHLEPEILVVDEVLAVGDAAFQQKCLGKMKDVAGRGRTILFVSHNMGAVTSLCSRGILLDHGQIAFQGTAADAVRIYSSDPAYSGGTEWRGEAGDADVALNRTWVQSLAESSEFDTGADVEIGIELTVRKPVTGLIMGFTLYSEFGYELAYMLFDDADEGPAPTIEPGKIIRTARIPANTLAVGSYRIEFDVGIHMVRRIIREQGTLSFALENITGTGRRFPLPCARGWSGLLRPGYWAQPESSTQTPHAS